MNQVNKKSYFSSVYKNVKVVHASKEGIARCNKNIAPRLKDNAKERTASVAAARERVGGIFGR